MRKLLVYWIQITDHGRCDDPRDHIWHTLDRYHYLEIGPGSDQNGIKKIFLTTNEMYSSKLGVLLVLRMKWSYYDIFFAKLFVCCHFSTTDFSPSVLFPHCLFKRGSFGLLVTRDSEQCPLQGSLRRHFLALVSSNWFNSFKWEDSLPIKTSPLALGKHHKLSFLSTSLAFSLYYD